MNARTPILVSFGSLLAAIAFAVLGLAADNASYFNSHRSSVVDVHYTRWNQTAEAQYSYWLQLDYAPSRLSLSKEHAEIATGVLCAVVGVFVAVGAWLARKQASKPEGASKNWLLSAGLACTSVTFIVSLILTVFAWQSPMKWSINFKNSIPLPPVVSNPSKEAPTKYNSPFPYTPEVWNCLLSPYIVGPQHGKMQNLCQEAKVARYLMIPLVIVSAFLVGNLAWYMWQAKKVSTEEVEMANGKEVDEVSVETTSVEAKY